MLASSVITNISFWEPQCFQNLGLQYLYGKLNIARIAVFAYAIYRMLPFLTGDNAPESGDDAGTEISGIKCHIAVDTQGLPARNNGPYGQRDRSPRCVGCERPVQVESTQSQKRAGR